MTNAEVCDATLRVGMDADRKDNLYDMIDVKNSTLLVEPSSLRKLIASWNKKQRPIGAADSSAKQGAINNSSISDFSKDVNEQHPITKRPANLVKTDELIYNRSKENGSENPVAQIIVHELTHSTGHAKRLNRLSETAFFGSEAYSKEELIAEIGAAALVHHAGLETSHSLRNSAAYIQNWLAVLKNDKRFIVSASGKADKAISLILGC